MVKKHRYKKVSEGSSYSQGIIIGSLAILAVLLVVSVITQGFGIVKCNSITGAVANQDEVISEGLDFVNEFLLDGQMTANLEGVTEESGIYKMALTVDGQQADVYITKDAKVLFLQPINIEELKNMEPVEGETTAPATEYSEETLENFAKCLGEKDIVFYHADWCGYCQQQKAMFGSALEFVNNVECTANEEVCAQEGITAYPTWKINGELRSGMLQLSALSSLTGCALE
jgi:thiol-disulfide isomerase/thioredoxin